MTTVNGDEAAGFECQIGGKALESRDNNEHRKFYAPRSDAHQQVTAISVAHFSGMYEVSLCAPIG